jgi:hypothetical protein
MTPEEQYKKNLALIDRKNPELAKNLDALPITGIRLVPGPSGHVIGQVWDMNNRQWLPLCDPNDPVGESVKDIEGSRSEEQVALYSPDNKIYSLLGMGNGYFAVEFAKRLRPYQRFAIFDVDPNCYKASMYCVDMEPLLGNARVDTFIGDSLAGALQNWWLSLNSHEKFHIAPPMRAGYTQAIFNDVYDSLMHLSMDMMRYHAVGLATWRQFGRHIGDNDFGNMPDFLMNPGMNELKDKWKGKPAFCLAAGPSLRKNLYKLINSGIRDKVAIITVGTVYALLQGLQFEPDLITTIDFQRLNFTDQFQNIPLGNTTPLLYLHSTHPETVRRWPGPRYVALNSSDSTEWMRQFTEPKMPASQVQTVAHLSFLAAIVAGASPIIMMGQDLAMPFNEHHAPGARAQDTAPEDNEDAHVRAKDIYDNDCWTRHSFLSMRTVFQQIMANNPGPQYLNCTEGGIHIEGAEDVPIDMVIETIRDGCESVEPDKTLRNQLRQRYKTYVPGVKWDLLNTQYNKLRADVSKILESANGVKSLARNRRKELKRGEEGKAKAATLLERIKKKEARFQELQAAFSLFAVRRFDMVELLSRIPPPDGTTQEDIDEIHASRIEEIADSLLDESASVLRLLKQTWSRIQDVQPADRSKTTLRDIIKMMSRQSYAPAAQLLNNGHLPGASGDLTTEEHLAALVRVKAQLYKHRQQYSEAAALLDAWDIAPYTVEKMRKIVNDNVEVLRPILPQYYLLPEVEEPSEEPEPEQVLQE